MSINHAAVLEPSNRCRGMSRVVGVGRAEEVAYCEVEEVEVYCGTWVVGSRNSGDMTTWSKDSSVEEYHAGENRLACCSSY